MVATPKTATGAPRTQPGGQAATPTSPGQDGSTAPGDATQQTPPAQACDPATPAATSGAYSSDPSGAPKTQQDSFGAVETALAQAVPCQYTAISIGADQTTVTIHLANRSADSDLKALAAATGAAPEFIYQISTSKAPAYQAQGIMDRAVAFDQAGPGHSELYTDDDGVTHINPYAGPAASQTRANARRQFATESQQGTVVISSTDESAPQDTASVWDYNPTRGGQGRWENMGGGNWNRCSSGPALIKSGSLRASQAGHCAPVGFGVWGGSSPGIAYLGAVQAQCGFNPGTCANADWSIYPSNYPIDGWALDGAYYRRVTAAGNSAGPPVGTIICFTGSSSGTKCGSVTIQSATESYTVTGGTLTVGHMYATNSVAIPGDSGGISYQRSGTGPIEAWGMVDAVNTTTGRSFFSNIYYITIASGTLVLFQS